MVVKGEDEGEEVLGIGSGITTEFFQSAGNAPDEREELKISESGEDMDWAVHLSIIAEILSRPGEVSDGKQESKRDVSLGVHLRSWGQGKGGGEGGWTDMGGQDLLKQL